MNARALTWAVTALAIAGVIGRPWRLPEAIWAAAGAVLLLALGLLTPYEAWVGVARGADVYLFLAGMMLLAEFARREGVFDWLAAGAARRARGSAPRLFALVYGVGVIVTAFLSNDATAVVLTPAVAAVARAAKVGNALPYLFACALVANAASFVLPVSNPANLVIYGRDMPPLLAWLPRFAAPSALSIGVTYLALRLKWRKALRAPISSDMAQPDLTPSGRAALAGLVASSLVLLAASALDRPLGLPTFVAGAATAVLVALRSKRSPLPALRTVSWGVLPLVAGLFVLVGALEKTGVTQDLASALGDVARRSPTLAAWLAGVATAFGCNLVNNLPLGLLAGQVVGAAQTVAPLSEPVRAAILIGVDLGPNLSVTGSLATILWLQALRREGFEVGAWAFLKLGLLAMPPALLAALAAL